ncbi:hypothetical protein ACP70R_026855 [Stipagrostis hirtigluma subsp. patula]
MELVLVLGSRTRIQTASLLVLVLGFAEPEGSKQALTRLQQTRESDGADVVKGINDGTYVAKSTTHNMSRRFSSASRSSMAHTMGYARDDESAQKPTLHFPSFRRLLLLNAPEWKQALMGSFCAVLCGGIQPVHSYCLGSIVSVYFLSDHAEIKGKTRVFVLLFVALAVLSFLLSIGQHYNIGAMGEHLTKRIRKHMLRKILTFEIGWFDCDENSTGAICSRLSKDANAVRSLVGDRLALVIQTTSVVLISHYGRTAFRRVPETLGNRRQKGLGVGLTGKGSFAEA